MISVDSFFEELELMKKRASTTAAAEAAGKVLPYLKQYWKPAGLVAGGGALALTGAQAKKDWELGRAIRKQQGG